MAERNGPARRRLLRRCAPLAVAWLALALRLIGLSARPLWYDEAFAILYASLDPARIVAGTVTPVAGAAAADVHPLLYYFSLHGWLGALGGTPFAARLLSAMLGVLTVALLWRLAAWSFDRRTAGVVGLLAAINPFHVAYSQEARMYALLGLAAVLAAWGLLRALEDGRGAGKRGSREARWWGVYAAGAALTLYAHNLGAFVLLALHALALSRRRWWRALPALALADLGVLLLFGPWLLLVLPGQLGFVARGYWLAPPGAEELVRALMLPLLTFYEPAPFWLLALGLLAGLLLLALLLLRTWRLRARAGWFLLLAGLPIVSMVLASRWRPVYLERALLPAALFYLLAVGWLFARGRLPSLLRLGLATLLAVSTVASLTIHFTYAAFPRPPFQDAAAFLQAHVQPGDAVVHTNKLTYFPMHVYDPALPAVFMADPPGSPQDTLAAPTQDALGLWATSTITAAVGSAEQVWLVYFPREVQEATALGGVHPALSWVDAHLVRAGQAEFNDLVVARYVRREP